jgi:predicted PurR-regulated permease PerM
VFEPLLATLSGLPEITRKLYSSVLDLASMTLRFLLGLIVAFYLLCDKERYIHATYRLAYVFLSREGADRFVRFMGRANRMFERFILGKALDSLIIGIMFYFIGLGMNLPYCAFLALIVGITNMLPYLGPFIGAVPVVLIVMLARPEMTLWTALVLFLLQQFDGAVLGPKILGDSTGLRPPAIICAILLGGAMFGVLGMFLSVPVFGIVKLLFGERMNRLYAEKYPDLPPLAAYDEPEQTNTITIVSNVFTWVCKPFSRLRKRKG